MGLRRLAAPLHDSELAQSLTELAEEFERLVPVQRRGTDGQHGDRSAPVLDELRDPVGQPLGPDRIPNRRSTSSPWADCWGTENAR
jgi:hypothetical protein